MYTYTLHKQTGSRWSIRLLRDNKVLTALSFSTNYDLQTCLYILSEHYNVLFPAALYHWQPS